MRISIIIANSYYRTLYNYNDLKKLDMVYSVNV